MNVLDKPLTNFQLEMIKIFSFDLAEPELVEVKRVLSLHFAKKASDEMDRLWEVNDWSDETMDSWLEDDTKA